MNIHTDNQGPHCHKCRKQSPQVDLVWCGYGSCDNSICSECATETEWELEACCDGHAAVLASRLQKQVMAMRAELAEYRLDAQRELRTAPTRDRRVA
jgi:hypothetical protein